MNVMNPLQITRAPDQAPLGKVSRGLSGVYLALRTDVCHRPQDPDAPDSVSMEHATLDAAVDWVRQNPNLPDATTTPHHDGIYGPLLGHWGTFRIVGCVRARHANPVHGLGAPHALNGAAIVVLLPDGRIIAKMAPSDAGWIVHCAAHPTVRRQRQNPEQGVEVLLREVVKAFVRGSMHDQMTALAGLQGCVAPAVAFITAREGLILATRQPPSKVVPPGIRITPSMVRRIEDRCMFGTLSYQDDMAEATRHDRHEALETFRHASLDAAVAWVESSPLPPDLARFPVHKTVHGPVLARMPNIKLVGHVGPAYPYIEENPGELLHILNPSDDSIGTLWRDGAGWHLVLKPFGASGRLVSTHFTQDAALGRLCHDLVTVLHPLYQDQHEGMHAGIDRAGIESFLVDQPRLIAAFLAGTTGA